MKVMIGQCLGVLALVSVMMSPTAKADTAPVSVLASIYPLQLIAELIDPVASPTSLSVSTLLPVGSTPHDYALKPSDIRRVLDADMVLWMGPDIEPYLTSIIARVDPAKVVTVESLPALQRLPVRELIEEDAHVHHHGHGHEHQTAFDPHVWWSVNNAEVIVLALQSRLIANGSPLPADSEQLAPSLLALKRLLAQKQAEAAKAAPAFMVFHDGLHYAEHDLGVFSVARMVWNDDHRPGIKTLLALKQHVQDHNVQCIVAEPTANLAIMGKIEGAAPLSRVAIDTLGWGSSGYLEMLSAAYDGILTCGQASP